MARKTRRKAMMYCSYCGKALLDDAVFCFACGKRVAVPDWTAGLPEVPDAADSSSDGERAFADRKSVV